jgi:hypothetical protein
MKLEHELDQITDTLRACRKGDPRIPDLLDRMRTIINEMGEARVRRHCRDMLKLAVAPKGASK